MMLKFLASLVPSLALGTKQAEAKPTRPVVRPGFAAHYRPGKMEQVAKNRGLPRVKHMAASPHHAIGTWVTAEHPTKGIRIKVLIVDCPQPQHWQRIVNKGIVLEFDFKTAQMLYNIKRVNQKAPRDCPIVVYG